MPLFEVADQSIAVLGIEEHEKQEYGIDRWGVNGVIWCGSLEGIANEASVPRLLNNNAISSQPNFRLPPKGSDRFSVF